MKLAVVNNCVPFVSGGAEYLAASLARKLIEYGHQAMVVRIPFRWEPAEKIVESMLASRLLRLENVDRVVALKFPAYYVPHTDKRLWLLHQFRQAYDLWGTRFQCLPDTPEGRRLREVIVRADNLYLREAAKIYTNSEVTTERLRRFNGIDSEVLYPPLEETGHLHCAGYGDYVFYPSRITAAKRQLLAVEAMQHVTTAVKLVIAGQAEAAEDLAQIDAAIRRHRLEEKVELVPRFISEQEKADWFSRALACAYLPYEEDSYGYVTLEAYSCRKAVVACSDSGGTRVVVKDGETGYVAAPEPRAIAAAFDRLYADPGKARRMGEAGLELIQSLGISWDRVIRAFTE